MSRLIWNQMPLPSCSSFSVSGSFFFAVHQFGNDGRLELLAPFGFTRNEALDITFVIERECEEVGAAPAIDLAFAFFIPDECKR